MLIVYMLRNESGGWYKASHGRGYGGHWVDQEHATIWTSKHGPASAKGGYLAKWRRRNQGEEPILTVVEFQLCPKNIAIVSDDEGNWEAMYINGKLAHQTHKIDTDVALDTLGIACYTGRTTLEAGASFPQDLKDVKTDG